MRKVIIVSPTHIATGGTELLQQLCFVLNSNGIDCSMYYFEEYNNSPVERVFSGYNNPFSEQIEDMCDNTVVVPEAHVDFAKGIRNAKVYYWWLSVDNYYGAGKEKEALVKKAYHSLKDRLNSRYFRAREHLVQSQYALEYLIKEQGVNADNIKYLSDYLSDTFLRNVHRINEKKRSDSIIYNPRKGYEFTKLLIEAMPEYKWIPLVNLSHDEMVEIMLSSKIYVDFGNHPGKDRIPREAAVCGCCVITGDKGAASNDIDIPINRQFKFKNDISCIDEIHKMIDKCMNDYSTCAGLFSDYRQIILDEESKFTQDALSIFGN